MSEPVNESKSQSASTDTGAESAERQAPSRRDVLKQGARAAPVLLTLASRPVLAWHCKSPSAWGSEQLDPTTSLAANAGHASHADETWTISNWKSNTARAGLGRPWDTLGYAGNWQKVTIRKLADTKGIVIPAGVDTTKTVVSFLDTGAAFQKTVIVAQLNVLLLSSLGTCITLSEVKRMATGTYSPPNVSVVWGPSEITQYLQSNYIALP